jgi:hypothetical protein
MDLALLTGFLVTRTLLSIYLASVNGRIVNAIIKLDKALFFKRVHIIFVFIIIGNNNGDDSSPSLIREQLPRVPEQAPRHPLPPTPDQALP